MSKEVGAGGRFDTFLDSGLGDNFMKLNADKCHLLILGRNSNQQVTLNIGDYVIENTDEGKLLGAVIDKKLTFDTHISKSCKKAGSKLFAFARVAGYMDTNKLRILLRAIVISQYQYCPLVWMFHSRHLNSKINRIHERALRIAYKDYQSNFNVLLENDCSVRIHVKKPLNPYDWNVYNKTKQKSPCHE